MAERQVATMMFVETCVVLGLGWMLESILPGTFWLLFIVALFPASCMVVFLIDLGVIWGVDWLFEKIRDFAEKKNFEPEEL